MSDNSFDINTAGGPYVHGNVNVDGDFVNEKIEITLGDNPFDIDEHAVGRTDIEKIEKTYVFPQSYERIQEAFNKRSFLWIVGPPGVGKRSLALHLAITAKSQVNKIFLVPGSTAWSQFRDVELNGTIIILRDTLVNIDFDSVNIENELRHLERLSINQNKIILTSPLEVFNDAKKTFPQLGGLITKIGVPIFLEAADYGYREKIQIFKKKIEYAHNVAGIISDVQRCWGMTLIGEVGNECEQSPIPVIISNRNLFQELLKVTWLPIDIDLFVYFNLSLANKANDVVESLRRDPDIESRIHTWFIRLDDSVKCFILTLTLFVGFKDNLLWEKYKEVVQELKKLDPHLAILPLGVARSKAYPYVMETGIIDFSNLRVYQAIINEIAKNYREYFLELEGVLKKWSIPDVVGIDKKQRSSRIFKTEEIRNAIARMVGIIGRGNLESVTGILDTWAKYPLGSIGKTAGIALRETVLDPSSVPDVLKLIHKWSVDFSEITRDDGRKDQVGRHARWAAASALWRISSTKSRYDFTDFALKCLQRLAKDSNNYVVSSAAYALGKMAQFVPSEPLIHLLTQIAQDSEGFTRQHLAQAVDEIARLDSSLAYNLLDQWMTDTENNSRWTAMYTLIVSRNLDKDGRLVRLINLMPRNPRIFTEVLNKALILPNQDEDKDDNNDNSRLANSILEVLSNNRESRMCLISTLATQPQLEPPVRDLRLQFSTSTKPSIASIPSDIDINLGSGKVGFTKPSVTKTNSESKNFSTKQTSISDTSKKKRESSSYLQTALILIAVILLLRFLDASASPYILDVFFSGVDKGEILSQDNKWNEIEALIKRWDEIHHYADQMLDTSGLDIVLTGTALEQQKATISDLQKRKCKWEITDLSPSIIVKRTEITADEVSIDVKKHWDAKLYCKGKLDPGSFDTPFVATYYIINTSDGWRISKKESGN